MPTQTELSAFARTEIMTDGGQTREFDPEAETVNEAWEGAFLSCSWGYDQTQVNFAQIVDVSDSGKTVVARRVAGQRVETSKASQHVKPAGEPFGDEFRLHVREGRDNPVFRGSYPFCSSGDEDEGTRLDTFMPQDSTESVRETAPGYGH